MISGVKALCLWPFVPLAIAVSLTAALYLSAWPLLLALYPPRSLAESRRTDMRRLLASLTVLALVVACASPALSGTDFVLIDRTEKAYTVYAGIPGEKLAEFKAALSSAPQRIALVTWDDFVWNADLHAKARIVKDEYPESRATAGLVELVRTHPGTPFGLT